MQHRLPLLAHVLALALMVATPVAALDLPARKPGLWEMKMAIEGRNLPPQTMQQCLDAATDKEMQSFGGSLSKDMCEKQDVTQVAGTIMVDSVCQIGPMKASSHAVISGDFNSAYTVKVTSKREAPAIAGSAMASGESNMTIEAKWLGACKADQKPGDIMMSNGMKMNIHDLPKGLPGMPGAGAPGGPPPRPR